MQHALMESLACLEKIAPSRRRLPRRPRRRLRRASLIAHNATASPYMRTKVG